MRSILRAGALAALFFTAACLGDDVPTSQVGGTLFNTNVLSVPSPVRLPGDSVRTFNTTAAAGQPRLIDSLIVTLRFLKPLVAPARYQVYLVNGVDGSAQPVAASIRLSRVDTTYVNGTLTATTTNLTELPNRAFYAGAPFNTTARLKITATGNAALGGASYVVVTIQADSSTPNYANAPKPLWFRFRTRDATPADLTNDTFVATGPLRFGTFRSPTDTLVYAPQGTGRAGFWQRQPGSYDFAAIAVGLPQPPLGYYYQPYIRDAASGTLLRFGTLTDLATGESLRDADLRPVTGTLVQLDSARFAATEEELNISFVHYATSPAQSTVMLVLEPKQGDLTFTGTPTVIQGTLPPLLARDRPPGGAANVTVRQAGAPVANATLAAYASGSTTPVRTAVTSAEGVALLDPLPSGNYTLRLFRPTGAVVSDTPINIVSGQTTTLALTIP